MAMNTVDVYSASWGPADTGATMETPGPLTAEALVRGVTKVDLSLILKILFYQSCFVYRVVMVAVLFMFGHLEMAVPREILVLPMAIPVLHSLFQ